MKRLTSLFFALGMLLNMQAAQKLSIQNYSVSADPANQAVFYSLLEADSAWEFNFYLYIEQGKHDIEWGKTYTLDDMNPYYCYWKENISTGYSITEASFTKTKGEGYSVNITAYVKDTEGREFQLSYTEAPTILTGDTIRVVCDKQALVERNNNGTWSIQSSNDSINGRVVYYSADNNSCAGAFAGDEVYLASCYINVFTGEYEYNIPVYRRIYAKDASVEVTEDNKRIDAHAVLVGEDGIVYDFTMAFEKPEIADRVTITSDSLLIETWGYDRFGTIQMSASDSAHKVIFWFEPYGLDSLMAGTYTVGERQFDGWVINLESGKESALYSGSVIVTYEDGAYSVEGALLCKNNVEYTLHLSIAKPGPTREDTIVFARIAMSIDEHEGWGAYGENAEHTKFISLFSSSTTVAGHYTEKDLIEEYCFVGTDLASDGSTNRYFRMVTADLDVTFNDKDSVAHITGTMFCISALDPNDRPLFTIDVTTAMDTPFFEDDNENFTAEFETYEVNELMTEELGTALVEARNAEGAFAALQFFVAEGATRLTAGTYPIMATEAPMTALASRGLYANYATFSIVGYANEQNQYSRIWFLVSGTITISENGVIQIEALNSNGKTVRCQLKQRVEAIEDVAAEDKATDARKTLRDGQLLIEKKQKTYNAQGIQIK